MQGESFEHPLHVPLHFCFVCTITAVYIYERPLLTKTNVDAAEIYSYPQKTLHIFMGVIIVLGPHGIGKLGHNLCRRSRH